MTNYSARLCPQDLSLNCKGPACMAWRWHPLNVGDAWIAAVQKAAREIGDKTPGRAKAARHVNANRAAYGLPEYPTLGYCGLAGKPEVID